MYAETIEIAFEHLLKNELRAQSNLQIEAKE